MRKKLNKRNIIIAVFLIIFIIILSIFLYSNLLDHFSVLEEREMYAEIIVNSSASYGVIKNGSALMFGRIPPGSSSSKTVDIENIYDYYVKVDIYSEGSISDMLQISDNNFVLFPGEKKTIEFLALPSSDTKDGTYTGKVKVVIRSPFVR